jgi:hypothetical protein
MVCVQGEGSEKETKPTRRQLSRSDSERGCQWGLTMGDRKTRGDTGTRPGQMVDDPRSLGYESLVRIVEDMLVRWG